MKQKGDRMYSDDGKWYYELPRKPIPQPPWWLSLCFSIPAIVIQIVLLVAAVTQ